MPKTSKKFHGHQANRMIMTRTNNRAASAAFFFAGMVAILADLISPAYSAGTIQYSLSQQIGANGVPLSGCKLYVIQAGTAAPQNAFSDIGLTTALPNPMICDANGRLPQFFLADGLIKIRLADKNGVTQVTADNIQVIGASSGGGGGGAIDATTILATGDIKVRYGTGVLTGFVRLNGRTIGSATSGATERANADCQPLFEYLWNTDVNLSVSSGRGASSNADWVANKTITLPDGRGRVFAGLDDMGATNAARMSSISSLVLGATGGSQATAISQGNLPAVNFTLSASSSSVSSSVSTTTISDPGHRHFAEASDQGYPVIKATQGNATVQAAQSGVGVAALINLGSLQDLSGTVTSAATTGITAGTSTSTSTNTTTSGTAASGGSNTPFNILQPSLMMTYYQKL